jgi:cobalt-zinc-cadmium efflux system outer membrane protein
MSRWVTRFALAALMVATLPIMAWADSPVGLDQIVAAALEVNPAVRAARARWQAASHSILQNYAPADPLFGFANVDSPTNGFTDASAHTLTVSQSLQFPGKAILQAKQADRNADLARLSYEATIRDIRAAIGTAYYQALLDQEVTNLQAATAADLQQVLKITQVQYSANLATQADFIGAEFDLAAARQSEQQSRVAALNDITTLNQTLFRPPDSPLRLETHLELKPIAESLDELIERATRLRQEILEAALTEQNSQAAIELARLEYAPDYTLGYTFDHYLLASGAPSPPRTQDHGVSIIFNVPIFFWFKQSEDVKRAGFDLEAARSDLDSIRSQTAANVTVLYRNARLAYETAILYRDSLIGLARQDFSVALVAYQSGKIDFTSLSAGLRREYEARVAYLQAVNQFFAARIALEQASGAPLPQ